MVTFGVLASGEGTNLQALIDATHAGAIPGRIGAVLADRPARALERAGRSGIDAHLVRPADFPDRDAWEAHMAGLLQSADCRFVVLAGFMRKLGAVMLGAFPQAILNLHPSLLPAFAGKDARLQSLAWGVKVSGVTVHIVDEGLDTGPVVCQEACGVEDIASEEQLARRLRPLEHRQLVRAVAAMAEGRLTVSGRQVIWEKEAGS